MKIGFRDGAIARIWKIKEVRENAVRAQLSVSHKKVDGTYAKDFDKTVFFISDALKKDIKPYTTIRLKSVVSTSARGEDGKDVDLYFVEDFEELAPAEKTA